MVWGKFSRRMSVQESGDRTTVHPKISKIKWEHPGKCTVILVVRIRLLRAMKRREIK